MAAGAAHGGSGSRCSLKEPLVSVNTGTTVSTAEELSDIRSTSTRVIEART
jgi:hypothetical protein